MSYHGTHVVVIEIPEGSWGLGIRSIYRRQTCQRGGIHSLLFLSGTRHDLRLTNRLPTESRKGEAILYS